MQGPHPSQLVALLTLSLRLLVSSRHYSTLDKLLDSVFTRTRLSWLMAQDNHAFTLLSLLVTHCGLRLSDIIENIDATNNNKNLWHGELVYKMS